MLRKLLLLVTLTVATVFASAIASPATVATPQPGGPVGSGLELPLSPADRDLSVQDRDLSVQAADETTAPTDTTVVTVTPDAPHENPVQTNTNGVPMFMSQDGADGEHASITVSEAMRAFINASHGNDYAALNLSDFAETEESNDTQTVFTFVVDGVTYRLALTKATP